MICRRRSVVRGSSRSTPRVRGCASSARASFIVRLRFRSADSSSLILSRVNARTSSIAGPYIEKIRTFYDAAPTESTWFGRFYRKLLAKYYRYLIPTDASILEIGCGSGELLSLLPNPDITGIDVSGRQIAAARRRLPHGHFVESAAENMTADAALDRTFDYIVLSDTVNVIPVVQAALERFD